MQQSAWECIGTWVAIGGISWALATLLKLGAIALDRHHRWF